MMALGARLVRGWAAGDVVLLEGPLGAGKTTLVRGALRELGVEGPVRSPTFNLIQTFDTRPPVMHVDLYRVPSAVGLGLEDEPEAWLRLIEWPDRLLGLFDERECWRVVIAQEGDSRRVTVHPPLGG